MATGSLYGSVSESTGLYGIGAASGGTYFEWFIFQDSATAPATPTGGSWSFSSNTGTAPSGWVNSPPPAPVNQVWVSIAVVDSRSTSTLVWSIPGLMTGSGFPVLSASGIPSAGTGLNGQLYVNTATTPQSLYFKQSGAWTQLTGSTLYATAGANSNITSMTGLTGGIATPDFVQFDTGITPTTAVGKLQWDPAAGGLQVGMAGGSVNLQIGQEEVVYVFNNTGSQINEGQIVKITGSQGQRVTVALAQANNDGNSATILGMATENIAASASGFITTQGIVNNVNTSGFVDGEVIYLSPTVPGGFTGTKPVAPNHLVSIGYVVKGGSGGGGSIFIHPQNGYELSELHDVLITSVGNNNLLRYSSAVPAWVNIAGPAGTIVGTIDTQTLTNKTISGASNTLTNIGNSSLVNDNVNVNGVDLTLGAVQLLGPDWILPDYAGNAGKVLAVNPSSNDVQWVASGGTGTVTSIDVSGGTTGLTTTGGPIITLGTITLGGTLAIDNGGTGQTNPTLAFNALAPSQTGNAGKFLTTNGTNTSWSNVAGAINYQGAWDANVNSPTLTSSVGVNGYYYVVSVAGSTNLNGINDWQIGDWAIFNGSVWQKIDQSNTVTSVAGRTGAVVLTTSDIGGLGTIATQNANSVAITGGSITASSVAITGGSINGTTLGATTASTANVTTLTASADSSFNSTGAVKLSSGTTGERPAGVAGKLRFNTTTVEFEGYNGTAWASVGGSAISNDTSTATNLYPLFAAATTGTAASVYTSNAQYLFKPSTGELSVKAPRASNGILINSISVGSNYTIATGDNGLSAGPVSVASGVTVTISSGSVWTVV